MVKPSAEAPGGGGNPAGTPSRAEVLRPFALALAIALGLAALAGLHRIRSQFSAANAPIELLWPFARPLFATAVELAFLVAIPVGLVAVAFRRLPRVSGEPLWAAYRAFVPAALPIALGLSVISVVAALAIDTGTSRPGKLAAELVEQARRGCLAPGAPTEIDVPLVKVRWHCGPKGPRVRGTAPIGRAASFSASEIRLNEDLTRIGLRDLSLEAGASPSLRIRAGDATISGLPPWGRPQKMSAFARGAMLALSALGASLLVVLIVLAMDARTRFEPWLTGVLVALALWLALSQLDRGGQGVLAYALLPIAAALAASAAGLSSRAVKRVARRWVRC